MKNLHTFYLAIVEGMEISLFVGCFKKYKRVKNPLTLNVNSSKI